MPITYTKDSVTLNEILVKMKKGGGVSAPLKFMPLPVPKLVQPLQPVKEALDCDFNWANLKPPTPPAAKPPEKVYLLVYTDEDTGAVIEKLTEEEIHTRVQQLELNDDEYTVIDGVIVEL